MDLSPCDNSDHVSKDLSVTTNSAYPALLRLNSVFVQTSYHMEGAFFPSPICPHVQMSKKCGMENKACKQEGSREQSCYEKMEKTGVMEEGIPWSTKTSPPPSVILMGAREVGSLVGMIDLTQGPLFHPLPARS